MDWSSEVFDSLPWRVMLQGSRSGHALDAQDGDLQKQSAGLGEPHRLEETAFHLSVQRSEVLGLPRARC